MAARANAAARKLERQTQTISRQGFTKACTSTFGEKNGSKVARVVLKRAERNAIGNK